MLLRTRQPPAAPAQQTTQNARHHVTNPAAYTASPRDGTAQPPRPHRIGPHETTPADATRSGQESDSRKNTHKNLASRYSLQQGRPSPADHRRGLDASGEPPYRIPAATPPATARSMLSNDDGSPRHAHSFPAQAHRPGRGPLLTDTAPLPHKETAPADPRASHCPLYKHRYILRRHPRYSNGPGLYGPACAIA